MFEKGDRLVYGVNGVCTVEEMRSLEIAPGSSRDYYVLRPLNDPKTTLSVPVDSPLTSRMRPLKTPEEMAEFAVRMKERFPDAVHMWEGEIDATLSVYIGDGVLGGGIQILED